MVSTAKQNRMHPTTTLVKYGSSTSFGDCQVPSAGGVNVTSWTLGDLKVVAIVFKNQGTPEATMNIRSLIVTIEMLREASSRRHSVLSW
jgi:hypothetical protein